MTPMGLELYHENNNFLVMHKPQVDILQNTNLAHTPKMFAQYKLMYMYVVFQIRFSGLGILILASRMLIIMAFF